MTTQSSNPIDITAIILTKNAELNITRCINWTINKVNINTNWVFRFDAKTTELADEIREKHFL